ncbi:MAG: hypothetical protein ACI9WU_003179 [Myxococcota bacterium]|jgi:hypothetical protein
MCRPWLTTSLVIALAWLLAACAVKEADPTTDTATTSAADVSGQTDVAIPSSDVTALDSEAPDISAPDTALPDTLLPDTLLPDTLLPDTLLPDTADAGATPDTQDAAPVDVGPPPICTEALETCAEGDACCAGSQCAGAQCAGATGPGICTDPERDTCGCGAVWDDCETAGTTCLAAGCDFPGICVTPQEMYAICNGPDVPPCFECPFCPEGGIELCLTPPADVCLSDTEVRKYTQQWLGCGPGGGCDFAFTTETCGTGEQCIAAECVPTAGCGPVPEALVGVWSAAQLSAELPGFGQTTLDGQCAAMGLDQYLAPLTITAEGTFSGQLVTDYLDTWSGCLQPHDQNSWAMVLQTCDVECYGNDLEPGKLGILTIVDGNLVITRTGSAGLDADGQDCTQGGLQWFSSVPLTILYSN